MSAFVRNEWAGTASIAVMFSTSPRFRRTLNDILAGDYHGKDFLELQPFGVRIFPRVGERRRRGSAGQKKDGAGDCSQGCKCIHEKAP